MPDWPHAPLHRFDASGFYFITASTYLKRHYYRDRASLDSFVDRLFGLSREHAVELQAWSAFSNHYHLVTQADGPKLRTMLSQLHSLEGHACNERDNAPGRKVWFQFRDTELTFEKSWFARLRYTHENPVKHKLVRVAAEYPWCSAGWFERTASRAFVESVKRVRIDRVNVYDPFEPEPV